MIWHLIAVVFAGLGAAGIALIIRNLSRKRAPKWLVPVFAGIGMLGYQVNFEYNWFTHKQQQLPASAQVIDSEKNTVFWRPWTFFVPMTTAFTLIDSESIAISQNNDNKIADYLTYRFEKQHIDLVTYQRFLLNCETGERIEISDTGNANLATKTDLDSSSDEYKQLCLVNG